MWLPKWPKIARYARWMALYLVKHPTQHFQYLLAVHKAAIVRSLNPSVMP
jgi:hypothetical protein